ncbi:hypothetical protein CkaCkLH20_08279 [Colletotrichum karsti]|uniref:AB hydrolase-1 domain-containing protein n=1 Tax=Colletotrichum karsti TaxID=1095194 RepID=A0A9P6I5D0_9PEZI|nr:uncharacterized protein CkaCkLH20_08279 [Colletotrichum karsti]KAF9874296.1 hypothetical protein CkaCkLH20_08279 [Colletotrichum karsti]
MSPSSTVELSDGATVKVRMLGNGDKTKPLLIALHGAPGLSDHREPESSFEFLVSRFRVLVYDARGSGDSSLKPPYTDARWVADVDELREWAGEEKFVLAGGSYGGFLALQYAITHPNRLLALILRDTWANGLRGTLNCLKTVLTSNRIKPDGDRQVRLFSGTVRDNKDFAAAFGEIVKIYTPENEREEVAQEPSTFEGNTCTIAETYKLRYETHNFAFSHNVPRFDVRSRLGEITAPTLIVTGRHDLIAIFEYSEEINRGIPESELVIFENSGHSPPSDEPELFQKTVSEFLLKWV